jgi:hypothetical protein
MRKKGLVIALGVVVSACGRSHPSVPCVDDTSCDRFTGGRCIQPESAGPQWCAYPDDLCESGMRWSDFDIDEDLNGECVPYEPTVDGGVDDDGSMPDAPPSGAWSELTPIPVNVSTTDESSAHLSPDGMTLFFVGIRGDKLQSKDIDYTTRSGPGQPFGSGQNTLFPVDTAGSDEIDPFVTMDGLELYFSRSGNILVSKRAALIENWPAPSDTGLDGTEPVVLGDGLTLYYKQTGATCPVQTCRTRVTRSSTDTVAWSDPVVESFPPGGYRHVHLSADGRRVLMSGPLTPSSTVPLATASRVAVGDAWDAPEPVVEFQTNIGIVQARWSWDEQELFVTVSGNPNAMLDLYQSHRE